NAELTAGAKSPRKDAGIEGDFAAGVDHHDSGGKPLISHFRLPIFSITGHGDGEVQIIGRPTGALFSVVNRLVFQLRLFIKNPSRDIVMAGFKYAEHEKLHLIMVRIIQVLHRFDLFVKNVAAETSEEEHERFLTPQFGQVNLTWFP